MPKILPGHGSELYDERFEQLTELMEEGMLLVRPGGLVCFASSAAREQYQIFSGDQFNLPPFFPEAESDKIQTLVQACHVDGSLTSFPATMQLKMTEWQGESAYLILLHPSSKGERAEQTQRESEVRYQVIVEQQTSLVLRFRPNFNITYANPAMCACLQRSREELVGANLLEFIPMEFKAATREQINSLLNQPRLIMVERQLVAANAAIYLVEMTDQALIGSNGIVTEIQSVGRALSMSVDQALEEDYRGLVENSPALICRCLTDGTLTYVNQAVCDLIGKPHQSLLGSSLVNLAVEKQRNFIRERLSSFSVAAPRHTFEFETCAQDGELHWIRWCGVASNSRGRVEVQAVGLDISEGKRTEYALRQSEQLFREMLANISMLALVIDIHGSINFANNFFLQLSGYQSHEVLGKNWVDLMLPVSDRLKANEAFRHMIAHDQGVPYGESRILTRSGEQRLIGWNNTILKDQNGNFVGIAAIGEDITERTRSEKTTEIIHRISQGASYIRSMEELYHLIHSCLEEVMPVENFFIAEVDELNNEMRYPYFIDQFDSPPDPTPLYSSHGLTDYVLRTGKPLLASPEVFDGLVAAGEVESLGAPSVDWLGVPLRTGAGTIGVMVVQSYTEGVRFGSNELQIMDFVATQVAMTIERARAESALRDKEEKYRALVEAESNAIFLETMDGHILDCNSAACQMLGYQKDELLQCMVGDLLPEGVAAQLPQIIALEYEKGGYQWETYNRRKNGSIFPVEVRTRIVEIGGQILTVVFVSDLTLRKRREREMEAIAGVSAALRTAITRADILPVILQQLVDRLNVHGAFISLLGRDRKAAQIELACGTWSALGGRKLPRRRTICNQVTDSGELYLNNQMVNDPLFPFPDMIDGVKAVACVPLIAQDLVFGALTVGYERAIQPDEIHILTAISDIAASAIQRAQLYEQTSRQAADLAGAYDATIEGWARALELRDKETQGHSRRVTELTLRLAAAMQLPEKDMIHIRRGVLLHDIGKMGIPDAILLKPGPLSDEEWITMRKHPDYAHEMLSSIGYLGPALDIPYCHHEKWDGSGYPRGLKGEEIPLYARIFSIVDVMDALTSSRPYRPAWSKNEALRYILRQSGTQFDPSVVDVFMRLFNTD